MNRSPKRELSAQQAEELIEEVTASDRQQARQAVADGVQYAQRQWIAAPLIAEALALELIRVMQSSASGVEVATYLRALAQELETQTAVH